MEKRIMMLYILGATVLLFIFFDWLLSFLRKRIRKEDGAMDSREAFREFLRQMYQKNSKGNGDISQQTSSDTPCHQYTVPESNIQTSCEKIISPLSQGNRETFSRETFSTVKPEVETIREDSTKKSLGNKEEKNNLEEAPTDYSQKQIRTASQKEDDLSQKQTTEEPNIEKVLGSFPGRQKEDFSINQESEIKEEETEEIEIHDQESEIFGYNEEEYNQKFECSAEDFVSLIMGQDVSEKSENEASLGGEDFYLNQDEISDFSLDEGYNQEETAEEDGLPSHISLGVEEKNFEDEANFILEQERDSLLEKEIEEEVSKKISREKGNYSSDLEELIESLNIVPKKEEEAKNSKHVTEEKSYLEVGKTSYPSSILELMKKFPQIDSECKDKPKRVAAYRTQKEKYFELKPQRPNDPIEDILIKVLNKGSQPPQKQEEFWQKLKQLISESDRFSY